jgi:cell division control protein 6
MALPETFPASLITCDVVGTVKFMHSDTCKNVAEWKQPMKNPFEDLINAHGIFENREVLRHSYVPEKLPHRNEQIERLAAVLSAGLKGETPSNILIYGKTGTGKTSTVKYVSNKLEEIAQEVGSSVSLQYINSIIFDTPYRVFAQLARVFNSHVPEIGWPTDMVYSELKKGIDTEKRCVIVILDEVDKLASKGDGALYLLSRINSELNNARLSLIGISNDLTFADSLDPRIKSSLSEEEIIFPPYNAEQLRDILSERAEKAFNEATLDDAVIPLCAGIAASEDGDARRALDLLRISGEITERLGSQMVCEEHVRLAIKKLEINRVAEVVKTLPLQSKIVLSSVLVLNRERRKKRFQSGEVYSMYRRLCNHLGMDVLTQGHVSNLVSELDILGLINAVIMNKGRYGRTREISLSVPEECVQPILFQDYKLKTLAHLRVKTQATL